MPLTEYTEGRRDFPDESCSLLLLPWKDHCLLLSHRAGKQHIQTWQGRVVTLRAERKAGWAPGKVKGTGDC